MLIMYPDDNYMALEYGYNDWYGWGNYRTKEKRDWGLKFFVRLKNVPDEIQQGFATLLTDPEERVRDTAVKFFSSREEVVTLP